MRAEDSDVEVCSFETPSPNPFAAMLSLAPSSLMAEAHLSVSPVIVRSACRLHADFVTYLSDIQLHELYCAELMGSFPLSECSTDNFFPHTQLIGHFEGGQPYLRAKVMQSKAVLIQRESGKPRRSPASSKARFSETLSNDLIRASSDL